MTAASAKATGRVVVHTGGFGFVNLGRDAPAPSAFIPPPLLNRLLADDLVEAVIRPSRGSASKGARPAKDRWEVVEVKLLARERQTLFGTVVAKGDARHLRVDPMVCNRSWPVRSDDASRLVDGGAVVARIDGDHVTILRQVASADMSLERVLARYGVRAEFGAALEAEAAKAAAQAVPVRRDLRELPTITIDAPTSRDLDDALSALPADAHGAIRVFISIADVDALVPAGSALDLEALTRGTSVYLAGRVIPMLPPELSENALSLLPDTVRPAMTVELRIDPEGAIVAVDLYESTIRSHARLDYESVATFLDTGDVGAIPADVVPTLKWLRSAAARISATRVARGGVEFLREEAHITIDADSREPTEMDARRTNSANALVERLMVAANEAVARWLSERGVPAAFRVHDAPDETVVKSLEEAGRHFGFELGLASDLSPRGLAALQAQFRETTVAPAMQSVLMRTLGPARYTATASAHFGLAAPLYLHFTSPIRRYADLLVHRQVKAYLRGERTFSLSAEQVERQCIALNELARLASKAEAERMRMLAARWFATKIGEHYWGNVVAVKPFGLIVQLAGVGVTGTVQASSLPGEPVLDQERLALRGEDAIYTIGQSLHVAVNAVDEELGRIDLTLVGQPFASSRE